MREKPLGTLWVCVCCLFARESEGCQDHECDREPWSEIEPPYTVTLGMLAEHHECGRERGVEVDECDCERREFSWQRCDGCGSMLGGAREAYTLWGPVESAECTAPDPHYCDGTCNN